MQVVELMLLNTGVSVLVVLGYDQSTFGLFALNDTKFFYKFTTSNAELPMAIQVFKDLISTNTITGNIDRISISGATRQLFMQPRVGGLSTMSWSKSIMS